jgi:predicted acylesterase/phospholipase RssA
MSGRMASHMPLIGLALAGGAARGCAHLGVIRALTPRCPWLP